MGVLLGFEGEIGNNVCLPRCKFGGFRLPSGAKFCVRGTMVAGHRDIVVAIDQRNDVISKSLLDSRWWFLSRLLWGGLATGSQDQNDASWKDEPWTFIPHRGLSSA